MLRGNRGSQAFEPTALSVWRKKTCLCFAKARTRWMRSLQIPLWMSRFTWFNSYDSFSLPRDSFNMIHSFSHVSFTHLGMWFFSWLEIHMIHLFPYDSFMFTCFTSFLMIILHFISSSGVIFFSPLHESFIGTDLFLIVHAWEIWNGTAHKRRYFQGTTF